MKSITRFCGIRNHANKKFSRAARHLVAAGALGVAAQLSALATPPPAGIAPLGSPSGGFAIDGDLSANTPATNVGDWVGSTNAGTGGAVLTAAGVPINPTTTFHFIDPFNDQDNDLTFSGNDKKWTDDPNDWEWTTSKPSAKTDINNVLLHVTTDTNGHIWAVISGDRLSTSGDSYLDFEFLQNSLIRTSTNTFVSTGPHGGRTTNDLVLSVAFVNGGSVADFFVWRWRAKSGGGFDYFDETAMLPTNGVFVALNTNSVPVPYGAFGATKTNYDANAFAEAALDLTALFGNFDTCLGVGFKTIMVKTKASQSDSAIIEDFIDPIQYTIQVGPSANAGADQTNCAQGAVTDFLLQGAATPGTFPISSTTWSVISGTVTIDATNSLVTTAHVASATATLRLTALQANGCIEIDDIVLRVAPLPSCSITGAVSVCPRLNTQFTGIAGMNSYSWTVTGNGSISGATHLQTVTVTAGTNCGQNFSLALTVTSNGCSSTCMTDVLVNDTNPPSIFCPTDVTLQCPANTTTNATGAATAQDDCGLVTVSYDDAETNGVGGTKIISRTWTATDGCGNTSNCVQTITVNDTLPPSLVCPPNQILECPADTGTNATGVAISTDGCGSVLINYSDSVSNGCGATTVILRTWSAMDESGNTTNCVQTITVRDTTRPSLVCPPNMTLNCPADTDTNATGVAIASDTCGDVTLGYSDIVSNNCGGTKLIQRTWTATDECGNSTNCLQTITVLDTNKPSLHLPDDMTLDCPADTTTNNTGVATAEDTCSTVTVTYDDATTNLCGNTKVILRTWIATDECSNILSGVQTITVRDITPPTITCPTNLVLECPADTTTNATGMATAQDECSDVTISYNDDMTNGCGGSMLIFRTWSAVDACGNSNGCVQTITVQDTTAPTLTCPSDRLLECPADTTTNNTGVATATDTCSSVVVSYDDSTTNLCGNTTVTLRTWTATDACGNSTNCVQTITVQDTTPPSLAIPSDKILECPADDGTNNTGVATAEDTCGSVIVGYSDSSVTNCGNTKVITRTWIATDDCGNSTNRAQTITIRDTTAPMLFIPPDALLQCPADTSPTNNGIATAEDACGTATVSYEDFVTNNCGGTKIIARMWTATDECSNTVSLVQTIIVQDTNFPSLRLPADMVLDCPADTSPTNTGVATSDDTCSTVTVTYDDATTNLCGNTKIILRTWTGVDECSNTVSGVQMITVRDITPPSIICPTNLVLECPADTTTNFTGVAITEDECSAVTLTYNDNSTNPCGNTTIILRTWTAIDECGNSTNCVQSIIVQDTTAPSLTCPTDRLLECPADTTTNSTGMATASDTCGAVTISYSEVTSNSCGGTMTILRTWTATDSCNNSTSCVQTITVQDTTFPSLSLPSDVTLECPADVTTNSTGTAISTDACGSVTLRYSDSESNTCGGTTIISRTWTAVDECGNTTNRIQTITVQDTTPPSLVIPTNMVLECPAITTTNITGTGIAEDACGSATLSYNDLVTTNCGNTKVIERTWTALDECGNSTNQIQTITVRDTIKPVITCPTNLVLDCPAVTTTNATGVATATDSCGEVTIGYSDFSTNTCGGAEVILRTWTATDECGNSDSCIQTITVRDTTRPSLIIPTNIVLECPATDTTTNVTGTATATDTCGAVTLTFNDMTATNCGATKVISRTWMATDACGNTTNRTQTITVRDTVKPTITCPTNITLDCLAVTTTNVTGVATASDGCSAVTIRFSDVTNNNCGNAKIILRTWTATDACGNSNSCVQTITVRDVAPPTITCPSNAIVECGASTLPAATGTATAQDTCSTATVTYTDSVSNSCGNTKVILRAWKATDACGNSNSCVQTITVRDTTPPSITCRAVEVCTYSQGGWSGGGTPAQLLQDYYTTVFPQGLTLGVYNPANGNAAPNGLFWQPNSTGLAALQTAFSVGGGSSGPITQDAVNPTDTFGAAGLGRQTLALSCNVAFNTAGLINGTPNDFASLIYTKSGDSLTGKTVSQILEAANRALAGLGLPAGYDFSSLSGLINDLNLSFHDCNVSSFATTYLSEPSVVVRCASQVPAPDASLVSASDACSSVTLNVLPDVITEQTCANRFVVVRTWVATDACGNSNSCSYRITVNDSNAPTIICPANRMLDCPAVTTTNVTGVATATDNCGGAVTVTFSDVTNSNCGNAKVISRTWTATDLCGNSSSCVQTITVRDITPPTITCPSNLVLECPAVTTTNVTGVPTVQDACSTPTVTFSDAISNLCGNTRVITRTWRATDACGNSNSCVQTITVRDTTPPSLTDLQDRTLTADQAWTFDTPVASDGCSGATLQIVSTTTNTVGDALVATRVWRATDGCGNQSTTDQIITVMPVPMLGELRSTGGNLLLMWPSVPSGYQLESSDSVVFPNWIAVPGSPVLSNGLYNLLVPTTAPQMFYRLHRTVP